MTGADVLDWYYVPRDGGPGQRVMVLGWVREGAVVLGIDEGARGTKAPFFAFLSELEAS